MIVRPWQWPEAVWPLAAALILVLLGLLPWRAALNGIGEGGNVYFFLIGMMLLAELARSEGLFDWLAALAAGAARGSAQRLFGLIYLIGVLVTTFLSNDATAVVMTPAVAAVARAACLESPLPLLWICVFIANAASFVLPISNPANLVVYDANLPRLGVWLARFALPSLAAIAATYAVLRFTQRKALRQRLAAEVALPGLSGGGKITACGIGFMAALLMLASASGWPLGLPTLAAGSATLAAVWAPRRRFPLPLLRGISWNLLFLVAGLFMLVQALSVTGELTRLARLLRLLAQHHPAGAIWGSGIALGLASNLMNNLPAGLIASQAAQQQSATLVASMLVGVDLGPNLSITGSLASLLWLAALEREGITVTPWQFLTLGLVVMPPALLLSLAALFAT
jgi:arsenical pump membrane protein